MSEHEVTEKAKTECGIIMPISDYGIYTADFWKKIRVVLDEAIDLANMVPHPVWEDDKTDIIHAKIVKNIATLPVAIGVIIGNNPNVMLECGMRLWTNLPLLLISMEGEKIPFDVGSISCLKFPKSFDYFSILELKAQVVEKLKQLTGESFKGFKSYYSLPAEVEDLPVNAKIDFNQFVKEVRDGFNSMNEELRHTRAILGDLGKDSTPPVRGMTGSSLSSEVYPYYQMGATGPTGSAVGYDPSLMEEILKMGIKTWNNASSKEELPESEKDNSK